MYSELRLTEGSIELNKMFSIYQKNKQRHLNGDNVYDPRLKVGHFIGVRSGITIIMEAASFKPSGRRDKLHFSTYMLSLPINGDILSLVPEELKVELFKTGTLEKGIDSLVEQYPWVLDGREPGINILRNEIKNK